MGLCGGGAVEGGAVVETFAQSSEVRNPFTGVLADRSVEPGWIVETR